MSYYIKKNIVPALVFALFIFSGCDGGNREPKSVLSKFFKSLLKNDFETARQLATPESKSMLDDIELAMRTDSTATGMYDMQRMKFGDPVIKLDTAFVPVMDRQNGEVKRYMLHKEQDGVWKVIFDKTTIYRMMADMLQEESPLTDFEDQMGTDTLNVDSLAQRIMAPE